MSSYDRLMNSPPAHNVLKFEFREHFKPQDIILPRIKGYIKVVVTYFDISDSSK